MSRRIFELEMADARAGRSRSPMPRLSKELLAEGDRKAKGLTFDDHGRPLVSLDLKDRATNGCLLERLARDSE
jgi:hypothetical protein